MMMSSNRDAVAEANIGRRTVLRVLSFARPYRKSIILFVLVIYVLMNVLVDVLYAYIDPRIEYR